MDNTVNNDIIEKAICKRVAIYKAIGMLPPIETKDLWEENKYTKPNQNNLKLEEKDSCVTMNEIKNNSMKNDWRDITDPKLRKKAYEKAWYESNKDKRKIKMKEWYEVNKDDVKERTKSYYNDNKDLRKSQMKSYQIVNKNKIKAYNKTWRKSTKNIRSNKRRERIKHDVQYKLSESLRRRLRCALNGNYKSGSAVRDLGCTIDELKSYLESKFQSGMTWDNWTIDGWHIDHIKPLASFDLTDRKQMLEACHYTNLQPLWATDNLSKSDKIL